MFSKETLVDFIFRNLSESYLKLKINFIVMKKMLLLPFLVVILFSCGENKDVENVFEVRKNVIILKDRDTNYPWSPSNLKRESKSNVSFKSVSFKSYLGYAWKGDNFLNGYTKDITYPVINTSKLLLDYPSYYSEKLVNEARANSFSYSNFDRYISNSTTINKISSGFSIKLGLFSLGSKRTMTDVFSQKVTNESKTVYGELNIIYECNQYKLQNSTNIVNKIVEKYLHKDFIEELYLTHPSEFVNNYGKFVLCNFITGGKAIALYSGLYTGYESEIGREAEMDKGINASYGFNYQAQNDGKISGNLGMGKKYTGSTSTLEQMKSLQVSVKTIGGTPMFAEFSSPQNIDNLNINLSSWLNSLSNFNNHAIVDIYDGGLIPISEFVLEENLKKKIERYIENGNTAIEPFQEPYIKISIQTVQSPLHLVFSELCTRYGDRIMLRRYLCMSDAIKNIIQKEKERLSQGFGLKIIADQGPKEATSDRCEILDFNNFLTMKKVIDSTTGAIFLLDDNNPSTAYTIRANRLLDDYIMRNLVDSLPMIDKSIADIKREYSIMAL